MSESGAGKPLAIPCATGGAARLGPGCTAERTRTDKGVRLTLRHADGGFRRFLIVGDGRGLATADGSEEAAVRMAGPGLIDVSVGGDIYRLPATLEGNGAGRR